MVSSAMDWLHNAKFWHSLEQHSGNHYSSFWRCVDWDGKCGCCRTPPTAVETIRNGQFSFAFQYRPGTLCRNGCYLDRYLGQWIGQTLPARFFLVILHYRNVSVTTRLDQNDHSRSVWRCLDWNSCRRIGNDRWFRLGKLATNELSASRLFRSLSVHSCCRPHLDRDQSWAGAVSTISGVDADH